MSTFVDFPLIMIMNIIGCSVVDICVIDLVDNVEFFVYVDGNSIYWR